MKRLALTLLASLSLVAGTVGVASAQSVLFGVAGSPMPESASSLYTIDPATGTGTLVGAIGFNSVQGIAVHPSTGTLYAVGRRTATDPCCVAVLLTIDPITGAGTEVAPLTNSSTTNLFCDPTGPVCATPPSDLAFLSNGTLYGVFGNDLVTINISTGAISLINPNTSIAGASSALAISETDALFANDVEGGLLNLNPATGETIGTRLCLDVAGSPSCLGLIVLSGMSFQPTTGVLYGVQQVCGATCENTLLTIDTATGVVTPIGPTAAETNGIAWAQVTSNGGIASEILALVQNTAGIDLPAGVAGQLIRALEAVLREPTNVTQACNRLGAFAGFVSAQSGKRIPAAAATELLDDTREIRATLGCR